LFSVWSRQAAIAQQAVLAQLATHSIEATQLVRAFASEAVREIRLVVDTQAEHVRSISRDAFDHLQSKSLSETAQVEHARAMNTVAVKNLQDALANEAAKKPTPKRMVVAVNGNKYDPDELEAF